jgi:hypothetical protein
LQLFHWFHEPSMSLILTQTTTQAIYLQRNIEACSSNHFCRGKAISITYFECVCSLSYPAFNGHAPYCLLWSTWLYDIFPYYLIKGTIFEKKKLLYIKCMFAFFLQILSKIFLILRRIGWDMIKTVHFSSCRVLIILVRF